jgi:membrane protein implicated in regulation of membrane protease activity
MFKGSVLFAMVFILITPQSRAFLLGALENLNAWAPFSYLAILLLVAAAIVSYMVVRKWPERVEPESPMAKYNREAPYED